MPVARPEPSEIRVIAHLDLDCFYVQVEQRKHPKLRGKPTGVVQYNPWKGGGLIAVGYEARQFGVKRNMRGDEAKKTCPEIQLIQVPVAHGKADLTQYRDAGSEVVAVLSRKGTCERASIDEVYLDITEAAAELLHREPPHMIQSFSEEALKTYIVGYPEGDDDRNNLVRQWLSRSEADEKDQMLVCGAIVIAELRMAVLAETMFTCSAGIAHNKMLAKLASGMHKPAQQTLVPSSSVSNLLAALPIKKMKQLGGKLGDSLQANLQACYVGDLLQFSESKLQDLYGVNTGSWLWHMARGMSGDEVKARTLPKSHSCGKTFPGPRALKNLDAVEHWLKELAAELQERLEVDFEQNHRTAHLLTMHSGTNHGYKGNQDRKFSSKSCILRYGKEKIAQDAFRLFERALNEFCMVNHMSPGKRDSTASGGWVITSLFIGASNIFATPAGMNPITSFFSSPASLSAISVKESIGPSSPLASPPEYLALDDPSSPHAAQSSDDEGIMISCKEGYILGRSREESVSNCSFHKDNSSHRSSSIPEPTYLKRSEREEDSLLNTPAMQSIQEMKKLSSACSIPLENAVAGNTVTSGFMDQILKSSLKGGEQSPHDNWNYNKMTPDVSDDDEVTCTPTFGNIGHVKTKECSFQLPSGTRGSSDAELHFNSGPPEVGTVENSVKASPLVIHCSPVEHGTNTQCFKETLDNRTAIEPDVKRSVEEINSFGFSKDQRASENKSVLQRIEEPPCSAAASSQQSGLLKLEDIWHRKASSASQTSRLGTLNDIEWNYKLGEIDEAVLSELPEEIQEELYQSLGFKRPRTAKRCTIGDFFRSCRPDGSN